MRSSGELVWAVNNDGQGSISLQSASASEMGRCLHKENNFNFDGDITAGGFFPVRVIARLQ